MRDAVKLARSCGVVVTLENIAEIRKLVRTVQADERERCAVTVENAGMRGLGTLAAAALIRKQGQRTVQGD